MENKPVITKEIPIKKIHLQASNYTVELYEFLNTGEVRNLQRVMLDANVPLVNTPKEFSNDKTKAILNMQDLALEFIFVKASRDSEDVVVSNPIDWVATLPPKDGSIVYNEVTSIMNSSMMPEDAKKN